MAIQVNKRLVAIQLRHMKGVWLKSRGGEVSNVPTIHCMVPGIGFIARRYIPEFYARWCQERGETPLTAADLPPTNEELRSMLFTEE